MFSWLRITKCADACEGQKEGKKSKSPKHCRARGVFPRRDLIGWAWHVLIMFFCILLECSDTVEQRTWIHSICLNILVPFTFCFLYGRWTWDCSITAWSFFLPEASILNVLTMHETLFETHIIFLFRSTHTPKKNTSVLWGRLTS